MFEGKHSLVLHNIKDPDAVYEELIDSFYQGKAVGYQWPVFESEFSGVGKVANTNSSLGAELTMAGYHAAKDKKFPLCYLTMGGEHAGFGNPDAGAWGMHTDLINRDGKLSLSALALAEAEEAPEFEFEEAPPPPPDDDSDDGDDIPDGDDDGVPRDLDDEWGERVDRGLDLLERVIDIAEEHPEWIDLLILLGKGNLPFIKNLIVKYLR